MPHAPDWHILDSDFQLAGAGLSCPGRVTSRESGLLAIENLDRADPPGYTQDGVPRGVDFNRNLFRLSPEPCMPGIRVVCSVAGFDPATTPIQWRLVCRHVLCRHSNAGNYRYVSASEAFEQEWRGEARAAAFTLFGSPSPDCTYTYNDATRVLGGHGLLMVAVPLQHATLLDYVHVRIAGANPTRADVLRYLDAQLAGYDRNILQMVRAIFSHESAFTQFSTRAQSAAAMTFGRRHHKEPAQPDCRVRFDWPDDPPHFPLASFDFGVGIAQFTRAGSQRVSAEIAWDWRENIRLGTNLFLGKLRRKYVPGISWKHWALAGWRAYNGSGAAADHYAQRLAMSEDGAQIPLNTVPGAPQLALLAPPPVLGGADPWIAV